ncbi:hypothetical protein M378DRAFT_362707 [Amanita muscaria Koide BX008]|uniref:Uncharacterized protein n=1 Tax=Amanita muscaria (strain Koide BX008) TaxID=946122 RepID=A0A0C2WLY9_AMAMK|nr:hypothetical protein M378DRAFT_362707 [Amanita muscaria Koide BX008]
MIMFIHTAVPFRVRSQLFPSHCNFGRFGTWHFLFWHFAFTIQITKHPHSIYNDLQLQYQYVYQYYYATIDIHLIHRNQS